MTLKSDAKFKEKLTCGLENDMRNVANFHQSTKVSKLEHWWDSLIQKSKHSKVSKIFALMGSFWATFMLFELDKCKRVIFHDTEEIWRGIGLSSQNWHEEFDKFWPEHSIVSKICKLMGSFWPKYIMFELKRYREVMFDRTED